MQIHAQFYVTDGTGLQLDQNITSREVINIINQNLTGQAEIIFNAEEKQHLLHHKDKINLPGLRAIQTNLVISSSFIVRGDMSLNQAVLVVNQPVILHGNIISNDKSTIEGEAHILKINSMRSAELPFTKLQHQKIQPTPVTTSVNHEPIFSGQSKHLTRTDYLEDLKPSHHTHNTSPPPKST